MKKLFLKGLMALALVTSFSVMPLCAMEESSAKRVYAFDHDDVINTKEKLGVTDYIKYVGIIARLGWSDPQGAASLLWNWRMIKDRGHRVATEKEGTSNVIYALAQELKKEGYADLTNYVEEMTAITLKPKPIWSTINYIKELKQRGEVVIGATNQDYIQNKYFRKRMEEQGVNFDELFDGIVTSHSVVKAKDMPKTNNFYHELEDGIFMPTSPKGHKPNAAYYKAVKAVAKKFAANATTVIFTDDKEENIIGAKKSGLKAVHFDLPEGKSARRCTPEQIAATFAMWKSAIEKIN